MPVWVKLSKIPLELMTNQGISCIASGLGVPIYLEQKADIAFKANSARVCIDITMQEDLPSTLTIMLDEGLTTEVEVQYPWKVKNGKKKITKKWVPKQKVDGENTSEIQDKRAQGVNEPTTNVEGHDIIEGVINEKEE